MARKNNAQVYKEGFLDGIKEAARLAASYNAETRASPEKLRKALLDKFNLKEGKP